MVLWSKFKRKVLIRTDSNEVVSSGHVMRCLSIADALRSFDIVSVFAVSSTDMNEVIRARGYDCVNLGSDWSNLACDFPLIERLLESDDYSFVLIDTYSITNEYVSRISAYCPVGYLGSKALISDSLTLIVNYSTAIDQDFYAQYYGNETTSLLGPQYAPLRKQFANVKRSFRENAESVLITSGNTGDGRFLASLFSFIRMCPELSSLHYSVVCGRYFSQEQAECELLSGGELSIDLLSNVSDMADLMLNSDVSISACGTTVYELGACSVPTIGFCLVEEQVPSAKGLRESGSIMYAGESFVDPNACAESAVLALRQLAKSLDMRRCYGEKLHRISDGKGALRIAEAVSGLIVVG